MKAIHLRKRSGSSLVVVISVLGTLMVIVAVAAEYTWVVNRHVVRSNTQENALAVGDSCIDILFANWRTLCRAQPTIALASSAFSAATLPLPTAAQLNLPAVANFAKRGTIRDPQNDEPPASPTDYDANYTISNYKVIAVTPEWTALASAATTPQPQLGLAQTGTINTTSAYFSYIASADVTLPALGPAGQVVAKVRRVFQKQQLSPWNFAIFYVDPLEIHPGPLFTVTGWVHTNSDLYTGHSSLTFADKVTYGSDWFAPTAAHPTAGFKPGDGQHPETPTAPNYPSNLPPAHDDAKQPFGLDSTSIFSTSDANPNNDSYHELIEPPKSGFSDPLATQRYWDQAGVVIEVSDNTVANQVGFDGQKGPGHDIVTIGTPNPDGTITPSAALTTLFKNAITTNQAIQDNREGASLGITTLDISQIVSIPGGNANPTYLSPTFSNIIYMYNKSETSAERKGIRIKGGSKIPTAGLTIASNNPVYIQGDFNTGATGPALPSNSPSNANADGTYINPSNPPAPQATGYTRAPCSILADAVNVLSNSWSDANAGNVPAASATTVNAAFIAGVVPTAPVGGDGSYSGGAENFPRFLEDWTNKTFTYYGSIVELYQSKQSIGEWGKGSVYSPPSREWYFDNNFKTKPPPGSIMLYSYVKGKWSLL
jgi:hypothetical protein